MGKTIVIIIGCAILLGGFISSIALTMAAAGAQGMTFWEMSMLNKFGMFMLIWNYNPAAYLSIIALMVVGAFAVNIRRLTR